MGAGRQDSGELIVTDLSLIMQHNHSNQDARDAEVVYIYSLSEATQVLRPNALDSSALDKNTAGGRHLLHIQCLLLWIKRKYYHSFYFLPIEMNLVEENTVLWKLPSFAILLAGAHTYAAS